MKSPNKYDEKYWINDLIFLERKYMADRREYVKQRGPLKPDRSAHSAVEEKWEKESIHTLRKRTGEK